MWVWWESLSRRVVVSFSSPKEVPHPVRHTVLLDRHLEEVSLAALAGTVHQRDERLLLLTLPLPHVAANRRDPDLVAFLEQLATQTSGRQTLLRRRPARPLPSSSSRRGTTRCSVTHRRRGAL